VAEGHATNTRQVIMHPIGSFAQALLDVASKPLQPISVGSLCFQPLPLHGNIIGIRLVVKAWCIYLYFDGALLCRKSV
jgi:hypothetical protein